MQPRSKALKNVIQELASFPSPSKSPDLKSVDLLINQLKRLNALNPEDKGYLEILQDARCLLEESLAKPQAYSQNYINLIEKQISYLKKQIDISIYLTLETMEIELNDKFEKLKKIKENPQDSKQNQNNVVDTRDPFLQDDKPDSPSLGDHYIARDLRHAFLELIKAKNISVDGKMFTLMYKIALHEIQDKDFIAKVFRLDRLHSDGHGIFHQLIKFAAYNEKFLPVLGIFLIELAKNNIDTLLNEFNSIIESDHNFKPLVSPIKEACFDNENKLTQSKNALIKNIEDTFQMEKRDLRPFRNEYIKAMLQPKLHLDTIGIVLDYAKNPYSTIFYATRKVPRPLPPSPEEIILDNSRVIKFGMKRKRED